MLKPDKSIELPDILDMLIVGGGPGGTAAAFRAKELGLSVLVLDFDDLMKRIRDYSKNKLILPGFGGGDKMKFPKAGKLISQLHFLPIDKDDMCTEWKGFYQKNKIPTHVGIELTGLQADKGGIWKAMTWNHETKKEQTYFARHVVLAIGRGVPRRFDIPGNLDSIAYNLTDAKKYVGFPACVIGGGTSAAEAVIAISNAKKQANDPSTVFWSYRGQEMPKVSKALAEDFFEAYMGNGNIRYHPNSEPVAVETAEDRKEYLSIRTQRKFIDDRPNETHHLEFPLENCIACIGEDIPEKFLKSLGIHMVTGGPKNKKRMVTTPLLETQQPNVYLIGDILSQAYLETDNFDTDPATFREIRHRGNIKAALRDGVFVAEVIKQKLERKTEIRVILEDAETDELKESSDQSISSISKSVDQQAPPSESLLPERAVDEPRLVRIVSGTIEEEEFTIQKNVTTTIGRKGCDINFAKDTHLSDRHASIVNDGETFSLKDEGSANGVFLKAVEGRQLEVPPGCIIRAGQQFLVFSSSSGKHLLIHYDRKGKEIGRHSISEKSAVLGRKGCDILLDSQDMVLSRRHVAVCVRDNKIYIKDLKSVNGTYLKVKNAIKLQNGDQFRVGQQTFNFLMQVDKDHVTSHSVVAKATGEKSLDESSTNGLMVTFKDSGERFPIRKGQTICEIAEENGLELNAECHSGICGSDPVRIISGKEHLNQMTEQEKETLEDLCDLDPSLCRLACMARPNGAVEVEVLGE